MAFRTAAVHGNLPETIGRTGGDDAYRWWRSGIRAGHVWQHGVVVEHAREASGEACSR